MTTEFLRNAGAAIVTRSVLAGDTPVKWMVREQPIESPDTGWRFFGLADTQDYLDDPANLAVADYNAICEIEPAVIGIYDLPIGSDLQLVEERGGRKYFVDNLTNEVLDARTLG